ncbi:MAG: hypothetical protein DMG44_03115 [Acidobacteria bacterium]|jgi:hypothetical protein|nr:MAG: hypothetical protein DMG44_03115 [Acidobacteriota bacterium]
MEDGETMTIQTGGKKFLTRVILATAALLGMMASAGAPTASAESYDKCQRRIAKADHRLHEAVEHHGWNSRQADRARHDLHEARERCWRERHRWWDEDGRRWHSDRDWDDHDHDHDRH